jgi:heme/copper-type cytochrome/quinol oxidase subunit 4
LSSSSSKSRIPRTTASLYNSAQKPKADLVHQVLLLLFYISAALPITPLWQTYCSGNCHLRFVPDIMSMGFSAFDVVVMYFLHLSSNG